MRRTHTEIVKLPNGSTAIISGVPDKCKHDDKAWCFTLGNGEVLYEKDYRCPTNEETYKYVEKVASDRQTWISGGSVCCSKCGAFYTAHDIIMMGD